MTKYIDPIAYAWRICNPGVPLPQQIARWYVPGIRGSRAW